MELFPEFEKEMQSPVAPLADRMRPEDWEKFAGQEHLVGEGLPLRELVESGSRLSFLLWGPPGTGKTTLARISAWLTESEFYSIISLFSVFTSFVLLLDVKFFES